MTRPAPAARPRPVDLDLPPTLQPMAITYAAPRTDKRAALLGAMAIYGCMPLAMMAMGKMIPNLPAPPPPHTQPVGPIIDLGSPELIRAAAPTLPAPAFTPPAVPDAAAPQEVRPTNPDDVSQIPDTLNIQPQQARGLGDATGQAVGPVGSNPPVGPVGPGSGGDPRAIGGIADFTATGLQVLKQVDPLYPPVARAAHIQGNVVLRMVVDERGYPIKAEVLEGPALLRAEAMRAAQQWQFVPARVGGQPMAATFHLTIKFKLI